MIDEEDSAPKRRVLLERPVLDPFSVEDLRSYIAALQAEIARAEAAITAKQGARGHADRFFKF
jgi:uncharacterized small protein (DUF1192 family)